MRFLKLNKDSSFPEEMGRQPSSLRRVSRWESIWKFARTICCTSGWYPICVAPIVTAGFFFSLYSSAGCQFIDLDVGFTPNNPAWNVSRAELGLFYYHDRSVSFGEETSNDIFYNGCIWYTNSFQEKIIDQDRTWKVSRVMAMIAVSSSLLVALTVWLIVLTPIPTECVWPGLLLPNTMLSFIAEGSKFLLFDIALCQNEVWFPSGVDSQPEAAESCGLGSSAFFGIAAGVTHLVALIAICWKTPKKRTLDPSYGLGDQPEGGAAMDTSSYAFHDDYRGVRKDPSVVAQDPSLLDEDIYTEGPSPTNNSLLLKAGDDSAPGYTSQDDDSSDPLTEEPVAEAPRISESRMAALSKMGAVAPEPSPQQMIEDLLSELDTSLAEERYD
jgi:hypothetical protein